MFFTVLYQLNTLTHYIESYKHIGKWLIKYNQIWHGIKANKNIIENHNCFNGSFNQVVKIQKINTQN